MTIQKHPWVEAGKILGGDPTRAVPCPNCGKANLEVIDALLADGSGLERYLRCPACGANVAILMRNPVERKDKQ